jgi:hypothetical protein
MTGSKLPLPDDGVSLSGVSLWIWDNAGKTALAITVLFGQWLIRNGIKMTTRLRDVETELTRVKDSNAVERSRTATMESAINQINITLATVLTRLEDDRSMIVRIPEETAAVIEARLKLFSNH